MKQFALFLAAVLALTPVAAFAQSADKSQNKANYSKASYNEKDIVDTAVSAKMFETLVAAVKAAGLVETLKGDGPFTVFAPTDEAFAKLPAGTVENLLKPENKEKLANILKYHVVSGRVMAADVVKMKYAKTVLGEKVKIKVKGGNVMIGDAKVIKTDVTSSNGVIHVIDTVLIPARKQDIVDTAVSTNMFNTLVAAVKAAGLVDTLKGKGPAPTNTNSVDSANSLNSPNPSAAPPGLRIVFNS
ncbi:MAG TPA: fasciclin domain-containing protein [Aridibacter sp.]|nr:fasciclin domain-containing protein [Aridibacter sp.]